MSSLARYFHTIRHLRPIQVAARLRLRMPRRVPSSRPVLALRTTVAALSSPIAPESSLIGPSRLRFLNVEGDCVRAEHWRDTDAPRLWIYNLHYFDDLNARGAETRSAWHERLVSRWIAENAAGQGPGWEPYPLSRRVVNWVKWTLGGHALPEGGEASLALQVRWLTRSLEYHLLGNHLLANAKALVFAGLFFSGSEADGWLNKGMGLLRRELREQVLDDGGHFELTPMYHATVLEDLLDIINVCATYGISPAEGLVGSVERMRRWLQVMQHPDGDIAFFNDAALRVAATPAELEAYAGRLGLPALAPQSSPLVVLADSGYLRAMAGPAYVLCDCARVGPDHLPGHAHADTLSFEMSLYGQRLFVNSGTSRYGIDEQRQQERGTAAHNTVVIDGQDSSEVWSGFRVARRAYCSLESADAGSEILIQARHDGYCRLPGRNSHRRKWVLRESSLTIDDRITGAFGEAVAFLHLHPAVRLVRLAACEASLELPQGQGVSVLFEGASDVQAQPDSWHPGFGESVPTQVLRARFVSERLCTRVDWRGLQ